MDISTEYFNKKTKKPLWFWIFSFFSFGLLAFIAATLIAYISIPSVNNINDCFVTSMYQVNLCPKSSSYVRYSQLPKHLVASLIVTEDASFFFHNGFDWDEIQDSLEKSMDAGRWVRGGSTLTQQLAKNLYLSKERSIIRKLKEFFIAQQIEERLSKAQIIEKYFNVVEFAKGVYGVNAAANHYFHKPVGALTPAEGAFLISLLPSPVRYSATFHARKDLSDFNKKRVTRILSLLHLQHHISDETYEYERARTLAGLWTPFSPGDEPGTYMVNGEKKSSESSESDSNEENSNLENYQDENREIPAQEEDLEE